MLAPEWRLRDLRSAHIVNLPTPRRRAKYRLWAVLLAASTVLAVLAALEKPLRGLLAVMFALATYGCLVAAREVGAQLRSPPTASFDEPAETGVALDGVANVAQSGGAGLIDTAAGVAGGLITRLLRRRKPGQAARWHAATSKDLLTAELRLVSCRAYLAPHGRQRLLLWLTLGLAGFWTVRWGWLTVTDQRMLFHSRSRFRRGRVPYVHLSAPLAEVELLEWYLGSYTETYYHVLIMRCPDDRVVRIDISRVWTEEAQWAFEVIASCSTRPPHFLAARWSLAPGGAPS